jgi:hypothetical protein
MSHLLYLNSRDNYPNKCPHICLHLLVKQRLVPLRAQTTGEDLPHPGGVLYRSPYIWQPKTINHADFFLSSLAPFTMPKHLKLLVFLTRQWVT